MLFSKPRKAIGVDIGSHSVKAVQIGKAGGHLQIEGIGYALVDRNQANVDPIAAQGAAVQEALQGMPIAQSLVVGALPGQTVVIRYPRLPEMPFEQIGRAVETEAGQNIPYDLSEVFLDWTVLETVRDGERSKMKVLLVAAKYEVIETRVQVADAAGIQYGILGVDSLALVDAAENCGLLGSDETYALVNMGASSTSIHFTKGHTSNFIRDVSWGAREMIQAIAKGRRCDLQEAESQLIRAGQEAMAEPPPFPEVEPAAAEPPAAAAPAVVQFGGGNLLDPLDDELGSLGEASPPPKTTIGTKKETEKTIDELLSVPLGRLVAEIRRSFDFYEQQLYEKPVDRLILSGGVAHMPLLQRTLAEELGLEHVYVANPTEGTLTLASGFGMERMKERPAQFMVATGLAARGAAKL